MIYVGLYAAYMSIFVFFMVLSFMTTRHERGIAYPRQRDVKVCVGLYNSILVVGGVLVDLFSSIVLVGMFCIPLRKLFRLTQAHTETQTQLQTARSFSSSMENDDNGGDLGESEKKRRRQLAAMAQKKMSIRDIEMKYVVFFLIHFF